MVLPRARLLVLLVLLVLFVPLPLTFLRAFSRSARRRARWYIRIPAVQSLSKSLLFTLQPIPLQLMLGKHLGHTTIRGNDGAYTPLLPSDVTVAKVLKDAGYMTALVGKVSCCWCWWWCCCCCCC